MISAYSASSSFAFCIDGDDGFHIAFKNDATHYNYAYGTESAGTITWTLFSTPFFSYGDSTFDIVAYKFGDSQYVHVVSSYVDYATGTSYIMAYTYRVTSAGVIWGYSSHGGGPFAWAVTAVHGAVVDFHQIGRASGRERW